MMENEFSMSKIFLNVSRKHLNHINLHNFFNFIRFFSKKKVLILFIFRKALVGGDMEIHKGDYVSVEPANLTSPVVIGRVSSMWQNQLGQKFMHAVWFW